MPRCPLCFLERETASRCPHCGGVEAARSVTLALAPGTLLAAQYRLGEVLGQPGGFGITYLAWDEKLATRVAIKEFFPREFAGRGTDRATLLPHTERDRPLFDYGLQQFLEEARTLARFDHPNIVRVRNFFEANGTGYLGMDYYDGESLFAYLARQPRERLREDLAVRIMLPVLDGLRMVHAEGMLHRDIDPHNIYLTTKGRVILLDFGAARMAVGDRSRSLSVILKPGYAPYEQYLPSGQQGAWTDVYACAATLYRMVTGQVPQDALSRMLTDSLRPAYELDPGVSPHLGEVLQRAMALKPEERPQTAEEFQMLLMGEPPPPRGLNARKAADTAAEASGGGRGRTRTAGERLRSRHRAPIAMGVVLLLAGSGAAIYGSLRSDPPVEVAITTEEPRVPAQPLLPEPQPEPESQADAETAHVVEPSPPGTAPPRAAPQAPVRPPGPPAEERPRPPVQNPPQSSGERPGRLDEDPPHPGSAERAPAPAEAEPDTAVALPPSPPLGTAVFAAGMGRCRDAVVSRNLDAIRSVYREVEPGDAPNRQRLLEFLQRDPPHLQITAHPEETAPQPSGGRATGQFRTEFRWRSSFGTVQRETVVFRADFGLTGEGWRMTTCRILGNPRLRA